MRGDFGVCGVRVQEDDEISVGVGTWSATGRCYRSTTRAFLNWEDIIFRAAAPRSPVVPPELLSRVSRKGALWRKNL